MTVLYLTLKTEFFQLIDQGRKTEEYREKKPYWDTRLKWKDGTFKVWDLVEFRNGYRKDSPRMVFRVKKILEEPLRYVIQLGERLD